MFIIRNYIAVSALSTILALCLNHAAADDSNFYISGHYGQGNPNKYKTFYDDVHLQPSKQKNTHIFGIAVGKSFDQSKYKLRAEVAVNHFHIPEYKATVLHHGDVGEPDIVKQKLKSNAIFGNVYIDSINLHSFIPYIGAGIGVSRNAAGNVALTQRDDTGIATVVINKGKKQSRFAWNIGAGLSYQINSRFTLDLINYKFYHLGKFSTHPNTNGERETNQFKMHSITTGIQASF